MLVVVTLHAMHSILSLLDQFRIIMKLLKFSVSSLAYMYAQDWNIQYSLLRKVELKTWEATFKLTGIFF